MTQCLREHDPILLHDSTLYKHYNDHVDRSKKLPYSSNDEKSLCKPTKQAARSVHAQFQSSPQRPAHNYTTRIVAQAQQSGGHGVENRVKTG